nr:squalene synthase [Tanacetum cinerariifolium]
MSNNTTRAQCIHCFNFLSASSNSTLWSHFTHPHCEALKVVLEPRKQSIGRDGSVFVYNPDYLRKQFASLVIQRGLPFNHFDHEQTTRVFQNTMQPKYNHGFITQHLHCFRIRFFNKWKGVVNLKNKTNAEFFRDMHVLKDHFDAQERKQDTSTLENALDFEDEVLDAKVQENEATPLSDEEIALDASSQGTMASGSRGEEP